MESHLTETRFRGELFRTTFQLRFLAGVIEQGDYLQACIDTAGRTLAAGAAARPTTVLRPLGPVAVFAAGNFPFAFSVAEAIRLPRWPPGPGACEGASWSQATVGALWGDRLQALRGAGAPEGTLRWWKAMMRAGRSSPIPTSLPWPSRDRRGRDECSST